MKQAHVFVSGFVQGVGFRAYIRSKARKIGVKGWIRNLRDDRVEGVFQGDKEKIEKLIQFCKRGPFFAKVENLVVDWEDQVEEFEDFTKEPTL